MQKKIFSKLKIIAYLIIAFVISFFIYNKNTNKEQNSEFSELPIIEEYTPSEVLEKAGLSKSDSLIDLKFYFSNKDILPCLGFLIEGVTQKERFEYGNTISVYMLHIKVKKLKEITECGCIYPDQPDTYTEIFDNNGKFIKGFLIKFPENLNETIHQSIMIHPNKFGDKPLQPPFKIILKCFTEIAPG